MKKINSYIDHCLIDEYAVKSFKSGYSLSIDDLPKHEIANFFDLLMEHDTTIRDIVVYHMQKLIDGRLSEVEIDDRSHAGYLPVQSKQTGETQWLPRRGVAC